MRACGDASHARAEAGSGMLPTLGPFSAGFSLWPVGNLGPVLSQEGFSRIFISFPGVLLQGVVSTDWSVSGLGVISHCSWSWCRPPGSAAFLGLEQILESEVLWFKGRPGQLSLEAEESSVRLSPKADGVQGPHVLIRILYFIWLALLRTMV